MKKMRQLKTVLVVEDEIDVKSITASAEVQQRVTALCVGADNYLVKPLGAASLRKTAAGALHQKERYYHVFKESISSSS